MYHFRQNVNDEPGDSSGYCGQAVTNIMKRSTTVTVVKESLSVIFTKLYLTNITY